MSAIKIEYNGIDLGVIRTIENSQTAMYDDTGLDQIGVEYKIDVQFIISVPNVFDTVPNPEASDYLYYGPTLQGVSGFRDSAPGIKNEEFDGLLQNDFVAKAYAWLQSHLLVPRRRFLMKSNDVVLLDTKRRFYPERDKNFQFKWVEIDSEVECPDDFGGPLPQNLKILGMFSKMALLVSWSCIVKIAYAPAVELSKSPSFKFMNPPYPVSLRYSQSQDIDERGYSTITTEGVLKATQAFFKRASYNEVPYTIDLLRNFCYPQLLPGYRRKSRYRITPDGMSLHFTFVDQELDTSPPEGVAKADGRFGITGQGGIWTGEIAVTLEGSKEIGGKKRLLETAIAICLSRIVKTTNIDPRQFNDWSMLWGVPHGRATFQEDLYDNKVSVSMNFFVPPKLGLINKTAPLDKLTENVRALSDGDLFDIYERLRDEQKSVQLFGIISPATGLYKMYSNSSSYSKIRNEIRRRFGSSKDTADLLKAWKEGKQIKKVDGTVTSNPAVIPDNIRDLKFGAGIAVPTQALNAIGSDTFGVDKKDRRINVGGSHGFDGTDRKKVPVGILLASAFFRDIKYNLTEYLVTSAENRFRGAINPSKINNAQWDKDGHDTRQVIMNGPFIFGPQDYMEVNLMTAISRTTWKDEANIENLKKKPKPKYSTIDFVWPLASPIINTIITTRLLAEFGNRILVLSDNSTGSQSSFSGNEEVVSDISDWSEADYLAAGLEIEDYNVEDNFGGMRQESGSLSEIGGFYTLYNAQLIVNSSPTHRVVYPSGGDGVGVPIQLFEKPSSELTVVFNATRVGSQPEIPFQEYNVTDGNLIYNGSKILMNNVDITAGGIPVYSVSAIANYRILDYDKFKKRPLAAPWVSMDDSEIVEVYKDDDMLNFED